MYTSHRPVFPDLKLRLGSILLVVLSVFCASAQAQKSTALPKKLPSAEKVVDNYLKAVGGKKIVGAIRDATYEWLIHFNNQPFGTARLQLKAPSSERWEMTFGNGQVISSSNASSAWEIGLNNQMRTLTGADGAVTKLQAALDASRLLNLKKSNIMARVVSLGDLASEPAYVVEFSTRGGARLHYYFSVKTGLITKTTSEVRNTRVVFEDYRTEQRLLEPHRIKTTLPGSGELTFVLQSVKYDAGIADGVFSPPAASESLDVAALLREVGKNQDEVEKRVAEFAFRQTETDREISSKGELKKQTVKVYEVYPLPNREPVQKLISENGVPLSPERAAKEDKRVQEEFLKAERNREKDEKEVAERRAEQRKKNRKQGREEDDDPEISQFLRVCEFVSPRRERFADRDVIVFDFRPRAGFKPSNRGESLISKLVGAVWIDPVDKQVIRLEARLAEGFKIAGGLLASLKPGAAMIMEQTRMAQGVWLPKFAQLNLSLKVLLFGGGDYNKTIEWSDYQHFSGDVKDYKLDAPKTATEEKKP
jgi:outer membrane lipoprotein-sorting protein